MGLSCRALLGLCLLLLAGARSGVRSTEAPPAADPGAGALPQQLELQPQLTPQQGRPPRRAARSRGAPPPPLLPGFHDTPAPPDVPLAAWQRAHVPSSAAAFPPGEGISSASFLAPGHPPAGYVGACLAARDAHADIGEWVRHMLRLGVSTVYVYDHGSLPPMAAVLAPFVAAGRVVYAQFSSADAAAHASRRPQLYAYDRCLAEAGPRHEWLAFFDVDEFLVFTSGGPPVQSLPALLQEYEPDAAALAVHWVLFGSSGHGWRPPTGTLHSYVRCLPRAHDQHAMVKQIVRPRCTRRALDPHHFEHNCSRLAGAVRTDRSRLAGPKAADVVHSRLALHHYATRSRAEFAAKAARGSGMGRQRGWEYFEYVDRWAVDWCWEGLRVWDEEPAEAPRHAAMTAEQAARYAEEEHEDHWRRGAAAAAAGTAGGAGGGP